MILRLPLVFGRMGPKESKLFCEDNVMQSIKRACQFVPVAIFILCMAAATAFAGQHGFKATAHGTAFSGKSTPETPLRMRRGHTDQSYHHRTDFLTSYSHGRRGFDAQGKVHHDRHTGREWGVHR